MPFYHRRCCLILLLIFCCGFGNCNERKPKILIFLTTFGYSHFNFDCSIAKWLNEAGYEVHSIIPISPYLPNMTCKGIKNVYNFNVPTNASNQFFGSLKYGISNMVTNGIKSTLMNTSDSICEALFEDNNLTRILQSQNFSIGISEYIDGCFSVYFSKIGIKSLINLCPTALQYSLYRNMGIFLSSSFIPAIDESFASGDAMNYWERIWNFYVSFYEEFKNRPMFEFLMVLIFGLPIGYSHIQYDCSIAKWLMHEGYEVHLLIPVFFNSSFTIKCSNFKDEAPPFYHHLNLPELDFTDAQQNLKYGISNMVTGGGRKIEYDFFEAVCAQLFKETKLREILLKEEFVLGMGQSINNCISVFFHNIGINTFVVLSNTAVQASKYSDLGIFLSSSFIPAVDEAFPTGDAMNYWERSWNFYVSFYEQFIWAKLFDNLFEKYISKYFPNENLSALDFRKNISLIVANTNLFLDFAKPTSPKIINIGGEMINEPKKLEENIENIYSINSDGVVFISFGTLVDTDRSTEVFKNSVKAVVKKYSNLQFIWKTNGVKEDSEFAEFANLHLMKWVDQQGILANPKTKLFFTHCGLNSMNEAAVFGVPMITMPIFGDQHYNSALVNKREIGIAISYLTVTPKTLIATFDKILSDPKYAKNSQLLSMKIKRNPVKGKDAFIKWTQYLVTFGNNYELNLESAGFSIWKYYCIEVIAPILFVIVCLIFILAKVFFSFCKAVTEFRKVKLE